MDEDERRDYLAKKEKNRRYKRVGGAIAATAVAGAGIFLLARGIHLGGGSGNTAGHVQDTLGNQPSSGPGGGHEYIPREPVVRPPEGTGGDQVVPTMNDYLTGHEATTHFNNKGVDAFKDWISGYKVRKGDTIWDLSERFQTHMKSNPNDFPTDAIKDRMVTEFQKAGYAGKNGFLNTGDILNFK